MRCALCHRPYIPEVMGMTPTILSIGDDEKFVVHQHCCDEVIAMCKKLNGKAYQVYIKSILKKLSQ